MSKRNAIQCVYTRNTKKERALSRGKGAVIGGKVRACRRMNWITIVPGRQWQRSLLNHIFGNERNRWIDYTLYRNRLSALYLFTNIWHESFEDRVEIYIYVPMIVRDLSARGFPRVTFPARRLRRVTYQSWETRFPPIPFDTSGCKSCPFGNAFRRYVGHLAWSGVSWFIVRAKQFFWNCQVCIWWSLRVSMWDTNVFRWINLSQFKGKLDR